MTNHCFALGAKIEEIKVLQSRVSVNSSVVYTILITLRSMVQV
jgi:hypothetical protein